MHVKEDKNYFLTLNISEKFTLEFLETQDRHFASMKSYIPVE